ncbi:MAG TPA: endonuclease/exonuclease/phosphatase family protein [Chitinophagales bacterium]|nr:endonuclease/exonuclease/phosphatase family protein [Chitinophagales bacterium]
MNRLFKMAVSIILILLGIAALYVGGNMLYGTLTDYKPAPSEQVEIKNPVSRQPSGSVFTFLIWNIGYSALGDKEDFFFDGGKMVRPSKQRVEENLRGITGTIAAHADADFILLQEVDVSSKRSHCINELEAIAKALPHHAYSYARNYLVDYIPSPLDKPWDAYGKVDAGLATYSRYQPVEAMRYSLPGEFGWPKKVFWLDRCLLVFRCHVSNGKQLVVVNQHLEAYDEGGIKKQQMDFMKGLLLKEFEQGNYVIAGGDWNQCPPGFDYQHFGKDEDGSCKQLNVPADYIPGWRWAFDSNTPSNRKLAAPYEKGKTFVTLIDFYLVSPNVTLLEVKGVNLDFRNSDHQPVWMKVKLE